MFRMGSMLGLVAIGVTLLIACAPQTSPPTPTLLPLPATAMPAATSLPPTPTNVPPTLTPTLEPRPLFDDVIDTTGLVAYYPFVETVEDLSGYNNQWADPRAKSHR